MEIVFSEKCLGYAYSEHIESPLRVRRAFEIMRGMGYAIREPEPASEDDLLAVHSQKWIDRVKTGKFIDPDTPGGEGIYEYARLSAGGAIEAARNGGFSLSRPPGHHAGRDGRALGAPSLGFCYFNNMAVAVRRLGRPALILDIDGHHGNGTQEIFLGDFSVFYISLHGVVDFPHTGFESELNCINVPLHARTGDEQYLRALDRALSQIDMARIEVVGISAGFDAHSGEIASLDLTQKCYRGIGERLRQLDKKVFGVLEGGYSGENIAADLHQLIQGMEGSGNS